MSSSIGNQGPETLRSTAGQTQLDLNPDVIFRKAYDKLARGEDPGLTAEEKKAIGWNDKRVGKLRNKVEGDKPASPKATAPKEPPASPNPKPAAGKPPTTNPPAAPLWKPDNRVLRFLQELRQIALSEKTGTTPQNVSPEALKFYEQHIKTLPVRYPNEVPRGTSKEIADLFYYRQGAREGHTIIGDARYVHGEELQNGLKALESGKPTPEMKKNLSYWKNLQRQIDVLEKPIDPLQRLEEMARMKPGGGLEQQPTGDQEMFNKMKKIVVKEEAAPKPPQALPKPVQAPAPRPPLSKAEFDSQLSLVDYYEKRNRISPDVRPEVQQYYDKQRYYRDYLKMQREGGNPAGLHKPDNVPHAPLTLDEFGRQLDLLKSGKGEGENIHPLVRKAFDQQQKASGSGAPKMKSSAPIDPAKIDPAAVKSNLRGLGRAFHLGNAAIGAGVGAWTTYTDLKNKEYGKAAVDGGATTLFLVGGMPKDKLALAVGEKAAGNLAKYSVPVANIVFGTKEGIEAYYRTGQAIEQGKANEATGNLIKGAGAGLMVAGGGAALTGVGAPVGAVLAGAGGLMIIGGDIYIAFNPDEGNGVHAHGDSYQNTLRSFGRLEYEALAKRGGDGKGPYSLAIAQEQAIVKEQQLKNQIDVETRKLQSGETKDDQALNTATKAYTDFKNSDVMINYADYQRLLDAQIQAERAYPKPTEGELKAVKDLVNNQKEKLVALGVQVNPELDKAEKEELRIDPSDEKVKQFFGRMQSALGPRFDPKTQTPTESTPLQIAEAAKCKEKESSLLRNLTKEKLIHEYQNALNDASWGHHTVDGHDPAQSKETMQKGLQKANAIKVALSKLMPPEEVDQLEAKIKNDIHYDKGVEDTELGTTIRSLGTIPTDHIDKENAKEISAVKTFMEFNQYVDARDALKESEQATPEQLAAMDKLVQNKYEQLKTLGVQADRSFLEQNRSVLRKNPKDEAAAAALRNAVGGNTPEEIYKSILFKGDALRGTPISQAEREKVADLKNQENQLLQQLGSVSTPSTTAVNE